MPGVMMELSPQDVVELKVISNKHVKGDTFDFKGHPLLKEYADYLIEYFEGIYEH